MQSDSEPERLLQIAFYEKLRKTKITTAKEHFIHPYSSVSFSGFYQKFMVLSGGKERDQGHEMG